MKLTTEDVLSELPLDVLLSERRRRNPPKTFDSLEELLTDPTLFGLKTATPVQRAICRIADGVPLEELANLESVHSALGCDPSFLKARKPREVSILSGIRVGKSLLAALLAVYWTQTCDVSELGPGETPRVSIVSISTDLAEVVFGHVVGRIMASERLKPLVIGKSMADSITLRHPTGTPVEICVVAGAKGGASLVARWAAGIVFDEYTKMSGGGDGAINFDDQLHNVRERLLRGSQIVSIGNPWAPHGPAYNQYKAHYGKPTEDLVIVKAPAWDLNPVFWNPEKVAKARENPDTFVTECLGEFRSPEAALFSAVEVDCSTRTFPIILPPEPRCSYRAAMDPATRGNGWTLVVTTRQGTKKKVVLAHEWLGSKTTPLSPKSVMQEVAAKLKPYGIATIDSDQHLGDALKDIAHDVGLHVRLVFWTEKEKTAKYMAFKTRMASGEIEIPPDYVLRGDLIQVQKRSTTNGVKIVLPKTADGRHCDYMPALVLAMSTYLEDTAIVDESTDDARLKAEAETMKKERAAMVRTRMDLHQRRRLPWNPRS